LAGFNTIYYDILTIW